MAGKSLYTEIDGELWLDNPTLITVNPKRKRRGVKNSPQRRTTMARRRRAHRARRRARRNYYGAGMIANPRRRRRSVRRRRARSNFNIAALNPHRRRRRSFRRNRAVARRRSGMGRSRSIFGISLPPMDAVLFTGAGYVVPAFAEAQILKFVPATWISNDLGKWAVKAASVVVPAMLVKRFVSQRAGNYMLIGGAAKLVADFVRPYLGLGAQPLLGSYYPMTRSGMGAYFEKPSGGAVPYARPARGLPAMIANAPDRLDPAGRF